MKSGQDDAFVEAHRYGKANWPGLVRGEIIKTGDRTYCLIGEWTDQAALAGVLANMIATWNSFRSTLEDIGNSLGMTDAVSGPVVLDLKAP